MERKNKHLSFENRQLMYTMLERGTSDSEIGKVLKRDRSIVFRERKRNLPPPYVSAGMTGLEKAKWSHDKAKRRRSDSKRGKRGPLKLAAVREPIMALIKEGHVSPEKISQMLSSSDLGVKVSGKAIRIWINKEAPELKQYLPEKGKKRIKRIVTRRRNKLKDVAAPQKRNIRERPQIVETRERAGDLEGNTIVCKQSKVAIVSVSDRKTKKHWSVQVPNLKSETVLQALIAILLQIPPALRHTFTFDNGSEFADWKKLKHMFGMLVYFCDPYCPWQKGSVEHANKRFRLFAPKGTDLSTIPVDRLVVIDNWLNTIPMDCLGGLSPDQAWQLEIKKIKHLLH